MSTATAGRLRTPAAVGARGRLGRLVSDPGVRLALLCTLALRLLCQVVLVVGVLVEGVGRIHGDHQETLDARAGGLWWITGPWQRWDALWFVHIARDGYTRGGPDVAFFPGFPLLLHVLGPVFGGAVWGAALVVPTVALVAGLALVHRLVREVVDARTATRTVILLCVLPTSFYLVAPYSESLFLLLSTGCLLALWRRRLLLAGALAAAAAVTRPQGILLGAPLAVEGFLLVWARRRATGTTGVRLPLRAAVATLAPAAALGAWYVASVRVYGVVGGFPAAEHAHWHARFAPPWSTLPQSVHLALTDPVHRVEWLNLAFLAASVGLVIAMVVVRGLPWSWVAYAAVSPLPSLFRGDGGTPLRSLSRYLLVCLPLVVMLARLRLPRRVEVPVLIVATLFMLHLLDDHSHFRFIA